MGDEGDARRHELGPGCLDLDRGAVAGSPREPDPVVEAGLLLVGELGLCDRGLEVDVPQRRGLVAVGLTTGQQPQEATLGGAPRRLADRRVVLGPVDRGAQLAEEVLEGLLVLGDEDAAQLDEVRAGDVDRPGVLVPFVLEGRRDEVGVIGEGGITADAEIVLDAAFCRQTVVVPPDRVEDHLAGHPLVTGDDVGLGVGEHVTDVQRAGDRRWRRVDRVDLGTLAADVEAVRSLLLPVRGPAVLEPFQ